MISRLPSRRLLAPAASAAALVLAPSALAAGGVSPARGATRTALVRALAAQDGSSAGITGVFTGGRGSTAVVCQRTPDAGTVRFLFRRAGRAWRYSFSTRGTRAGSAADRGLERACR